jgi:hypothetical protein
MDCGLYLRVWGEEQGRFGIIADGKLLCAPKVAAEIKHDRTCSSKCAEQARDEEEGASASETGEEWDLGHQRLSEQVRRPLLSHEEDVMRQKRQGGSIQHPL